MDDGPYTKYDRTVTFSPGGRKWRHHACSITNVTGLRATVALPDERVLEGLSKNHYPGKDGVSLIRVLVVW